MESLSLKESARLAREESLSIKESAGLAREEFPGVVRFHQKKCKKCRFPLSNNKKYILNVGNEKSILEVRCGEETTRVRKEPKCGGKEI